MDHNLSDSLSLDNNMGVDFDHTEDEVVSHEDITLHTGGDHEGGIPMEFENIEEQPMLIDSSNEIIVSDFIGDQFSLQEFSKETQVDGSVTIDTSGAEILPNDSETMIDLQINSQSSNDASHDTMPKIISVKAATRTSRSNKKTDALTTPPRHVAIAPKPAPGKIQVKKTFPVNKQFTIGPTPVTLITNKQSFLKNVSTGNIVQGNVKSNAVLAQIGKQLVMVPSGGSQRIKLVPSLQCLSPDSDQAQLIPTLEKSTQQKVLTKMIVQGQTNEDVSNQPAVITKIVPVSNSGSSGSSQTRYITVQQKNIQSKTVGISLSNKVLMASSPKAGLNTIKKQFVINTSAGQKIIPVASQGTTKKVVITANQRNTILQSAASTNPQTTKETVNVSTERRTQFHQIHVPGKGVQYIRVVTNSNNTSPAKPAVAKSQSSVVTVPSKTFVLTDSKGNLIQMTAEKMVKGQPPPLVMTGNAATLNKVTSKPPKLVRLAPVNSKTSTNKKVASVRSAQSLLVPLSPVDKQEVVEQVEIDHVADNMEELVVEGDLSSATLTPSFEQKSEDTYMEEYNDAEVEIECERQQSPVEEDNTSNMDLQNNTLTGVTSYDNDASVIVIHPKNYIDDNSNDQRKMDSMIDGDTDGYNSFQSPPQDYESDVSASLVLRPRKACNCTKSQCLKLYCDCFANGEFCNRCKCNNCHNNLENEELRQKAIRGCLERNPNAFRPKIGKSKTGGPEIIRRHNKGCNCKRSGCLKNYCECYEAKIACTATCKCVGCRNIEDTIERVTRPPLEPLTDISTVWRRSRQPCSFMTAEVIEAVCQCLVAAASGGGDGPGGGAGGAGGGQGGATDVLSEFSRCLRDIIAAAAHTHAPPVPADGCT